MMLSQRSNGLWQCLQAVSRLELAIVTQPAFSCSKSTIETSEHCVKSVQSFFSFFIYFISSPRKVQVLILKKNYKMQ